MAALQRRKYSGARAEICQLKEANCRTKTVTIKVITQKPGAISGLQPECKVIVE
jgi:hypothetical protein